MSQLPRIRRPDELCCRQKKYQRMLSNWWLLTDVSWTQSFCLPFSFKCYSRPGFLLGAFVWTLFMLLSFCLLSQVYPRIGVGPSRKQRIPTLPFMSTFPLPLGKARLQYPFRTFDTRQRTFTVPACKTRNIGAIISIS